jgi:Glycoside Hydrolase Family 113/Concanavalin A-like lectin/glucanases superfamily
MRPPLLALALACAALSCATMLSPHAELLGTSTAHAASPLPWQQKGFTIPAWGPNDLYNSGQALTDLSAAHANTVTFLVTCYTTSTSSTDINCYDFYTNRQSPTTPSDGSLVWAIQAAKSRGLLVALKPHVDSLDGQWRAYINPTDYATWFSNYTAMIDHYAVIAAQQGVQTLSIGSELIDMSTNPAYQTYWRNLISSVRSRFKGALTYNANWGAADGSGEMSQVAFWDALDEIGISAYFDLTDTLTTTTVSQLVSSWTNWQNTTITPLQQRWNKPVIFSEVGYRSAQGAAWHPWDSSTSWPLDQQVQVNCYEALFEAWANASWFEGVWIMSWNINTAISSTSTGYEVQNKPALSTVSSWLGASASTSGSGYSAVVLADGPAAYWRLNEAAGASMVADATGHGHTGTLQGGVTLGTAGVLAGDSAATFNGSTGRITVSSTSGLPSGGSPYSLEAWLRASGTTSQGLLGLGDYSSTKGSNALRTGGSSGLLNYWWGADLGVNTADLRAAWHHVVATFDGTTRRLYLDGAQVAQDQPGMPAVVLSNVRLGQTCCNEYFNGTLDEVAMYATALSATRIQAHYQAGLNGP